MEMNFASDSTNNMMVQRGPSSAFIGVSLPTPGKWVARISHSYQPYWLGAYQVEEEAAIAYDRAAIKLKGGDTPLNFHWTNYSGAENVFQSQYSTEEILTMIKDKTYSSNLMNFCSRHLSSMDTQTRNLMNEQGISYHLLFQKELTPRDVTRKCFLIPREYALRYFPPIEGIGTSSREEGWSSPHIQLTFYDKHFHSWTFGYTYWPSTRSFMLTKGWGHFLTTNHLNQKDRIMFYRCEYEGREFYMIDVHRINGEHSSVGRNTEQDIGLAGDVNMDLETDLMRGQTNQGFKLFGMQIIG